MLWLYVKLKTYLSGYRIITLVAWIVQISMLWFNVKLWTLFSGYMKATLIASILPDLGRWCWAACQSTRFAVTPVGPDLAGLLDCWGAIEPRWYQYILVYDFVAKKNCVGEIIFFSNNSHYSVVWGRGEVHETLKMVYVIVGCSLIWCII